MRFGDYALIAFRNIRRQKMRSALTIAAIVIGATGVTVMLTFVTSIKNYTLEQFTQLGEEKQIAVGPQQNLTYNQFGNNFNGGVTGSARGVAITPSIVTRISRIPHVASLTPTLNGFRHGGVFEYVAFGGRQLQIRQVQAFEPNGVIHPDVIAGRTLRPGDGVGTVLLTKIYADGFGFKGRYEQLIGQRVMFHTQPGYTGVGAVLPSLQGPQGCPPNTPQGQCGQNNRPPQRSNSIDIPARVVGVVGNGDSGPAIFITLHWALLLNDQARPENGKWVRPTPLQALLQSNGPDQPGGYDAVVLNVDSTANVAAVAQQIRKLGLGAATAQATIDKQVHDFNIISFVLGGVGLVALLIAALGVINTMIMAVLERTREIGVMRAVGAKRSTVRRLFTAEAAALGFFGGAIGVLIGYVAVLVANPVINNKLKVQHVKSTNILSVPVWLIFAVIVGTTLIGFASGLLPARRAARLDPVEALRYE